MAIKSRHQRLGLIILLLLVIGGALTLILDALNKNINFFVSPTDIASQHPSAQQMLRLGGIVKPNSVHFTADHHAVTFIVTDYAHEITVQFAGLLPDLFSPGRDIVANGHVENGNFIASEVLAKHDNNYMPANVKSAIAAAKARKNP